MKFFKKRRKLTDNPVILNDCTDFRYISPQEPKPFDISELHNSCEEYVSKGKFDERTPDFRDPAIDTALASHKAYLEGEYQSTATDLAFKIKSGAKAQLEAVTSEIAYLNQIESSIIGSNNDKGGNKNETA